MSLEEPLL